jgi:hypothetical protein
MTFVGRLAVLVPTFVVPVASQGSPRELDGRIVRR